MTSVPGGLQEGCVPIRWNHQGPYRGTIVLFHGFSACPQQYNQLGPLLAAQGMEVIAPLSPGHGNALMTSENGGKKASFLECPLQMLCAGNLDDNTNLPKDAKQYTDFVELINSIAAKADSPRAVAGLSVGGAMAAYAGQAKTSDGKALYARQLIMNPMLIATGINPTFMGVAHKVLDAIMPHQWVGWGSGCRSERSLMGRAGFCTFQVDNMLAAGHFGKDDTLDALHMPQDTNIAVIYDEGDPVISTVATRELVDKYRHQVKGPVSSCALPFTMHSMLSKYDNDPVGVNRWWTNELFCDITAYLSHGVPFKLTKATNPKEGNDHYCELKCTAKTCPYDIAAPIQCPYTPGMLVTELSIREANNQASDTGSSVSSAAFVVVGVGALMLGVVALVMQYKKKNSDDVVELDQLQTTKHHYYESVVVQGDIM